LASLGGCRKLSGLPCCHWHLEIPAPLRLRQPKRLTM